MSLKRLCSRISNDNLFSTYSIKSPKGLGIVPLNGATARRAYVGDHLIIPTCGLIEFTDLKNHHPTIILVCDKDKVMQIKSDQRKGDHIGLSFWEKLIAPFVIFVDFGSVIIVASILAQFLPR